MSQADVILEARDARRWFDVEKPLFGPAKRVRAVDGVSLQIRRGETLAIVGESGCGKSTLARLLVRLMEPSEGSVIYEGRDIAHLPAAEMRALRRQLQFVFQDPFASLNPRMLIGELIEEPLRVHGIGTRAERRAEVARILSRVGLSPEIADRYPHEFSGGQRQRIGIARALVCGPKVGIGDEPVSALDVSIQAQVINLLEDLKEALGLTLVVISHDLGVVRHIADRVAVMYLGKIVELAPVAALFAHPRHPYTAALLSAIPGPRADDRPAAPRLDGDPPNPIDIPAGCRFHPRCAHADEVCRSQVPATSDGPDGSMVTCHHARDLDLPGIDQAETRRRPAAKARFELYRAASLRTDEAPAAPAPLPPSKTRRH
jgi:oligopeptide/dipeptide ABC transporter ATP-binding protein